MILRLLGFSKQLDVLFIILTGAVFLAFDSSIFHVKQDFREVWDFQFDPQFHKNNVDVFLKYVLSGVIFVRTFTIHIFLALYVVMLWPAIFEDRPNLMVPWLTVGFIRCILVNLVTLATGSFVCTVQKGYHPICLDFVLSQILQHGPSVYSWWTILNYYKNLKQLSTEKPRRQLQETETMSRRKRAKSLNIPDTKPNENMYSGSYFKAHQSDSRMDCLLRRLQDAEIFQTLPPASRSLDSLLKTKLDDLIIKINSMDEYDFKTVSERAIELLQLKHEDVERARRKKGVLSEKVEHPEVKVVASAFSNGQDDSEIGQAKMSSKIPCSEEQLIKSEIFKDDTDTKPGGSEVVVRIHNMRGTDFGCQVSTLGKTLLNWPSEDVMRKLGFTRIFK